MASGEEPNRLVNEAQLLAGKVRHHQAMQSFSIDRQTRGRNKRMHDFAARGSKLNFITAASCSGQKLGCPRISGSLREMFRDKAADHPLARSLQHAGKSGVAVKNDALCRKRESAFRHLLYQLTIGVRRAFERIYRGSRAAVYNNRVDLAGANCTQHFFSLG